MKNISNKIISVFVSFAIIIGTFAFSSFALAADIELNSKEKDCLQDCEVNVTVDFPKTFNKAATLDLVLNYNVNNFELVSIEKGTGLDQARKAQSKIDLFNERHNVPGTVEWILVGSENYSFKGNFAKLTFKVKNQAANGNSDITLTVKEAYNKNHGEITSSISTSKLTLNIIRNVAGDMTFELNKEKNGYIIKSYKGTTCYDIVIPSEHNGLPVVGIDSSVFFNHSEITSIVIPDTVVVIGNYAFSGCSGLTEINLPDSVKTICENAFSECTGLKQVNFPLFLETIGEYAFAGCYNITSINLPFTLKSIDTYAFSRCRSLVDIRISKNTESIGRNAFSSCGGADREVNFIVVEDNESIKNYVEKDSITAKYTYVKDITEGNLTPLEIQVYTPEGVYPDVEIVFPTEVPEVNITAVKDKDYKLYHFNNKENTDKAFVVVCGQDEYGEGMIVPFEIQCMHNWNKTVITNPTCTNEGLYSCVCTICSSTKTEPIDVLGHKDSGKIRADKLPTLFETGIAHKICERCNCSFGDDITVEKVYPDVNSDNSVNSTDALEVLKYIVKLEDNIISGNDAVLSISDTNGDGVVNSLDALDILNIAVGKIELNSQTEN